jgi:two-component system chemotaxis response regulator CheY
MMTMPKRVLVVEDDAHVRELVSIILRREGFEVVESTNGKDALIKLNGSNVDVLVTDLNMPEMGGLELVRKLRNRTGSELTPVIMMTSENHESMRKKVENAGINKWILKPCIRRDLKKAVRKLMAVN